jgi:YD repeat-containing protein
VYVNSGELWATFDLQGLATGEYTVKIQDATGSATLANGFAVTNGPAGHLSVSLIAPSLLHTHNSPDGLTGTETGVVTIQYTNNGQTDIPAPIFDLQATNAEFNSGVSGLVSPSEVTVVGTNQNGPAGILQPGSQETVSYSFHGNFGFAQFISMTLSLGTLQGSDQTIDWSSLESSVQPADIDPTDWHLIWTRFEDQVGSTTQSLIDALSRAATTLSQIGETTNDLGTLLNYDLAQASGALSAQTLAQSVDLASSGGSVALSLTRSYVDSFFNRDAVGAFGSGWTFTYDILAVTDGSGNVTIESPSGAAFFTLQSNGTYVGSAGDTATLTAVDGSYKLTEQTGTVETFRIDGKISTITDGNGNVITVNYDGNGVVSGVSGPNGQSLTFTTNAAGEITSATSATGQTVTYNYDSTGSHLVSVSGPQGRTNYSYDDSGNPLAQNALTSVTNPDGTTQSFQYDGEGNLASQTGGSVGSVSYSYSGPGTVVETEANGQSTTLTYDANGNLVSMEDATGSVSHLTYDADGNLTSYTDPLGGTVRATFAPNSDQLTSLTDQDGSVTHYSYDPNGDLVGTSYDDGSGTTSQYSASGEVVESTDARGQITNYSYDTNGRLTDVTFSDGTSQAYSYDAQGDLLTATATDGGVTHYAYNAAGELSSVTDPSGRVESYGYNIAGQEIQRVEPDGSITNYTYNQAGQIAQVNDGNGDLLVNYSYDSSGRPTGEVDGDGSTTSYVYDDAGDISQIQTRNAQGSVTRQLDYTYDAASRPIIETSLDGAWTYTYDASGELTHAVFTSTDPSIPDQDLSYVYDAAGNRVQTIFNGATTDYSTNGLNQYTSANGTTYQYDADGNLLSVTTGSSTTTYDYNSQNQLVSENGPSGTTTYQYDALGNQVSSTVNGVRTDYVIDPLAISTSATGPLSSIAQTYNAAGAVTATYDYGNGVAALISSAGTYFYSTDANGNVTGLSGGNGNLVEQY